MIQFPLLLTLAFAAPAAPADPGGSGVAPSPVEPAAPTAEPVTTPDLAPAPEPTPQLSDPFVDQGQVSPQLEDPFANAQPQPGQAGVVQSQEGGPPPQQPPLPQQERGGKVGFFVGFDTRLSGIDRAFATTLGGLAGVILAKRFMLGGGGYSLMYHDRSYKTLTDTRDLSLNYGGAQLGAYALRSPRIDGGFNVFLGGGQLCMDSALSGSCVSKTSAFVSHIESTIYVRLASILRFGFSFGYNFVVDTSGRWQGPDSWSLSGWGGSIRVEFGKFTKKETGGGGGRRGRR